MVNFWNYFIIHPLRILYRQSPYFGWNGLDSSTICAEVTSVRALHWEDVGEAECDSLIERRFDAVIDVSMAVSRLILLTLFLSEVYSLTRYFVYRKIEVFLRDKKSNRRIKW